ncbi:Phenylalanine--tRNA ligase beta subunit [Halomicronema hongdechloris C2206]|uniref:Phenylalanine--tRNA ligase beta subunit n=1 Tax=Halomicronema hongdechloris C2206 TaxID=1641165 RepID=A0A1Z3HLD3_9CYAN|nr:phenylalanine--tRNA ligase subunit beta [Halomicronema hongdechloris]ASC71114.1 Phenylalanine--tRNA ligase beta subunit [Halomicronema hongdechloris C2206]
MRISLNWLTELVDSQLTPTDLADALTMAGFEVEDIEDRRAWADGVIVGRVIACDPHPDADKLSVCQVDTGAEAPVSIVCGATNVRAGVYVPVATVGTYLPVVDLTIKARKLRGVPSAGMICSLAELGLEKEAEGIHIFQQSELTVGEDARPWLGLDDVILELTSTANRADALSMVGIAREIAAIAQVPLRLPTPSSPSLDNGPQSLQIELPDAKACPIYIGTVLENLQVGPSPAWLQQRLQAAGTRPINNVVDITNYVLLEWGQPLHAFDRDRLQAVAAGTGLSLGVRYAKADESLQTLDGQMRSLSPDTLLITANDQPVALAGVMGGEATEVNQTTAAVMLEAAYFDAAAIRRSARSQGLRTEASARYERGVNPAELTLACNRALQLLQDLAGANPVSQTIGRTASGDIVPSRTLELRLDRVHQILGPVTNITPGAACPLPEQQIQQILARLGCQVGPTEQDRVWTVTVPAYRYRDLEREIDLIEEVARLYGYNHFADTLPQEASGGGLSAEAVLAQSLRAALRAAGLTELMHYSLTKPESPQQVLLANPLFAEYSALRPNLIDGLIDAFQFNLEQGNGPLNGFEIGRVFWRDDTQVREAQQVSGIIGGDPRQGRWTTGGREQPLSWYEAKGLLESVFQRLDLQVDYRRDHQDSRLHPGRTASLWVRGQQRLGTFGQLHPQLRQRRELPASVYVFQLDWQLLVTCLATERRQARTFKPYSAFPASDRDIAFFAPVEVPVADLQRLMSKTGGPLLESVTLFDEYRGENVPAGQRSLAFRLVYRALDRTLTEDDIEPIHQNVRDVLEQQFQVSLRS